MNIFEIILINPLTNGLVFFYKILGSNLGIAIIGFSLFLRVVLNPLTKPYMDSMKKMKKYSKELAKLKHRHKGDKTKAMQAQADFYKQKGINPGAGCLPYLIQIIILIALFNVFTQVLRGDGRLVDRFNKHLYEPLRFEESASINTKFLLWDVTTPDTITIPGLAFPIPGALLIISALVQLVSAKIATPYREYEEKIAERTKESSDDFSVAMQQSMVYTFPVLTLIAGLNFPSGLAIYWTVYSVLQAYQQYKVYGWGGATPWLKRLSLLQLAPNGKKSEN